MERVSRDLGLVVCFVLFCLFVSFVQKVLPFGNYLHHHRIGFASPRLFFSSSSFLCYISLAYSVRRYNYSSIQRTMVFQAYLDGGYHEQQNK